MTQQPQHTQTSRSVASWLFVLYAIFVVYGSLVPLTYVDRTLNDAIEAFKNIPFLVLGIQSRADWIANGVLYVPVGFLTAIFLTQAFRKMPYWLLFIVTGVFSFTLAVSVEFAQLFFPPRTVSLNDIFAECIGSLIGLILAARFAEWFQTLLQSVQNDTHRLKLGLLQGYVVGYIVFALFPYDFLLSWSELEWKYASSGWGWVVAKETPRFTLAAAQLLTEVALVAPFGFLLVRQMSDRVVTYRRAALIGLLLGVFVELAQFFIASGISQGLSVLSRVVGVCVGVALYKRRDHWTAARTAVMLRRYTLPLATGYLIALLAINSWFVSNWQGFEAAERHLAQVSFIPFYYHYFTSESKALFSLTSVCISYVPIGLLAWARHSSPRFAMIVGFLLASGVEFGKLFLTQSHPDPTNLLLAAATGGLTVWLLRQLFPQQLKSVGDFSLDGSSERRLLSSEWPPLWLLFCIAATGVWVIYFPAFQMLVGIVLIACTVAVWQHPLRVFVIIPAALPVFDLAPWSGRFFLDEFDALLFVTLTVAAARVPALPRVWVQRDRVLVTMATLLALSLLISTARGMWPVQLLDANSFNNYYSPYNALRIVKGAAWAYAVYRLSRRFASVGIDVRHQFAWGMTIGLGLTVVVIFWERVAFSGLWNFAVDYRVTGPFSAMHIGGAYIECFLAAATPFLLTLMFKKRHWLFKLAGFILLLSTTYALMVTFSRNGYTAFAVAVGTSLLVAMRNTKQFVRGGVILAGLVGAMLLVAMPIFKGEFLQSRMATVSTDLGVRQAHWDDALNIRDSGWTTSLFGMGLGRYPETNFWRSAEGHRSSNYGLAVSDGNTYLRLSSGDSLYVEQLVNVQPGQRYVLKLDVRASLPDAKITVPICEKWMLTSYNCVWQSLASGKEYGAWRSLEAHFTASSLSISPWYSQRPIKLALYYSVPNSTIDIDNVRLETAQGIDLLRNGDFSKGLDHWFFSTDGHLQWHIKSLFYGVLFDQGWFGFLALAGILGLALIRAVRSTYRGTDKLSCAGLAALSSFLVVGLFDTLIDAPRFLLLLLLLTWFCIDSVVSSSATSAQLK